MLRLFVGLELPDDIRQALTALRSELKGARWQTAEQIHLTLSFIGNVDDDCLPLVYDALYGLRLEPFKLTVSGVGLFGSPQYPKNLWAGVIEREPLIALHEGIHERLSGFNVASQERGFHPHVTLARFRGRRTRQYAARQDKREPAQSLNRFLEHYGHLALPPFGVHHVSLFSSTQRPEGSHYQVIGRFPAD
ncbi:RNA 2',3'-cyclic phosphodiesterase [Marinobacter halodurans]|uniref:RNA 2',3'-cyclic phosphodiesterase n=1 Tax=Marinobacter halodurans TaxID=2528979 RepID=A0ABY1ZR53_9GAMM|nr:RNA 2',3'-cyclic phosphodiesterase [Marinobacter halodurans]TBW59615.1 RNA 2',3'-cyclic phosphodiesterase [Marinobacter halodurans]